MSSSILGDHELGKLKDIVRTAGEILLSHYKNPEGIERKQDDTLVSNADRASSEYISKELQHHFPGYAIIDEEKSSSQRIIPKEGYCWVVDPLDGTREYLTKGKDFGIIIGLMKDGVPVFGMTYRPMLNELVYASKHHGAYQETSQGLQKIHVSLSKELDVLVTASRLDEQFKVMLGKLAPSRITQKGSSFKIIEVALGSATLFLQPPKNGMRLWDLCGPSVILEEAGGKITDWQGKPLSFTYDFSYTNGIIVSNTTVHNLALKKLE